MHAKQTGQWVDVHAFIINSEELHALPPFSSFIPESEVKGNYNIFNRGKTRNFRCGSFLFLFIF